MGEGGDVPHGSECGTMDNREVRVGEGGDVSHGSECGTMDN